MLYLISADKRIIESSYQAFLDNLRQYLEEKGITTWQECYTAIARMLRNGSFSMDSSMSFNSSYPYLAFPNMESLGAQVMYGVGCCRHVNALVYDILAFLGFNVRMQYIHMDKTDTWRKCNATEANHIAIILQDKEESYILDVYNNFSLKIKDNGDLIPTDIKEDSINFSEYHDSNIQDIGRVLKKYYTYQKMGIIHVYDYDC